MCGQCSEWFQYLASSLIASRSVFGGPLNKLSPDLPGTSEHSDLSITTTSVINGARRQLSGNSIGQNGTDNHRGTIRVPWAPVWIACFIARGNR